MPLFLALQNSLDIGSFRLRKMHKWSNGFVKASETSRLTFLGSRKKKGTLFFLFMRNICSNFFYVCYEVFGRSDYVSR